MVTESYFFILFGAPYPQDYIFNELWNWGIIMYWNESMKLYLIALIKGNWKSSKNSPNKFKWFHSMMFWALTKPKLEYSKKLLAILLELKLFIDSVQFLVGLFLYLLLHLEKKFMKVLMSVHFLENLYGGIYWIVWSDIVYLCTTFFIYITQYMHIIVKIKGHFCQLHFRVKWW